MNFLKSLLRPTPVAVILREQLYEAERMRALHVATAERDRAMAEMYDNRIDRLRSELDLIKTGAYCDEQA